MAKSRASGNAPVVQCTFPARESRHTIRTRAGEELGSEIEGLRGLIA
jgi:hypothetical protein